MADLVMGAMGSLIPKLSELLKEEYNLRTGVKERINKLTKELEVAQAALRKVAEVPWDQLDEQVRLWAREVRESSYDMEDVVDTFLVRVQGPDSAEQEESLLKRLKKMANFFKKTKVRRKISGDVNDIMSTLQQVTERCRRYKVNDIVGSPATVSTVDPRLHAMYTQVNKLVGLDKSSSELMSKLQLHDASNTQMKIVSIFGTGGLGKTSLAKAVYDNLRGDFNCRAFVSVGQNPYLPEVLHRILIHLNKKRFEQFNFFGHGISRFIDEFKIFHRSEKRCFIVIDDLWEEETWESIKLAIGDDNNSGSRILITTRKLNVAKNADEVYQLPPLTDDSCRHLLYARIYGDERKHVIDNNPDNISNEIVRKCGGIPLAVITMASLLVGKPKDKWSQLCKSIGFWCKGNKDAEKTMSILKMSYYDLPAHLRACLLYLSAFPEDSVIHKGSLVWKWIAEGFVHKEDGISLFETGEGYFNDLINRSMIQAVGSGYDESIIIGCRVHDMVLDFIRNMSQEENFFTVLDSNKDTLLQSNVRRLASHNKTMGHPHKANHVEKPKLRSLIALGCVIETWAPLSSFTLLRVLAIENFNSMHGSCVRVEDLGHLLHLRFLSLSGTQVDRIPKEIGALRFLQTLDLLESHISELPSASSMPKQLVCLRIALYRDALDGKVFSVEGLTSLEELSIKGLKRESTRRLVKDLSCLSELRVLETDMFWDEETKRGLVESVSHLDKLQTLIIHHAYFSIHAPTWQATELVLPSHLQHLAVNDIRFWKLPSCINPSCLPNLSHLDLRLQHVDEQDLKILGGLPELRFLGLDLWFSSATISNIDDSDACYFPKLRCCRLPWSMVLFVANKEDKSVSFHMWNGLDHITIPSVADDELKKDDELQSPMPCVSDDDEFHHRPLQCSKLQQGFAAVVHYLLAFFLLVLAFVKRWSLENVGKRHWTSDHRSAPSNRNGNGNGNGNGEDPAAMPFSFNDEKNSIRSQHLVAKAQCFMPSLQVLHFEVRGWAMEDHRCCDNLGLEYLSSLRELNIGLGSFQSPDTKEKVEAALTRAAQVHPNRPALRIRQR